MLYSLQILYERCIGPVESILRKVGKHYQDTFPHSNGDNSETIDCSLHILCGQCLEPIELIWAKLGQRYHITFRKMAITQKRLIQPPDFVWIDTVSGQ